MLILGWTGHFLTYSEAIEKYFNPCATISGSIKGLYIFCMASEHVITSNYLTDWINRDTMRSQFILFGFLRVVSCVGISSGTTSSVVTTPVYISTSLYTSQSSSNSAFSFLNTSLISTSATSSFTSQVSSLTIPSTSHSSAFSSSSGYGFTSEYSVITSLSSHGSSFISPTLTTLDTSTTSSSECPSATSTGIDALTDDDFSPELLQASKCHLTAYFFDELVDRLTYRQLTLGTQFSVTLISSP